MLHWGAVKAYQRKSAQQDTMALKTIKTILAGLAAGFMVNEQNNNHCEIYLFLKSIHLGLKQK